MKKIKTPIINLVTIDLSALEILSSLPDVITLNKSTHAKPMKLKVQQF